MKLIMGGINGEYLRNITENHAQDTEEVLAAVAYCTDSSLLFDWCWNNKIPLRYYGRLDESVAVSVPVLTGFLNRKSPDFVCRLVQHHHAKVIWWRGVGVYIGSANLTDSAWYRNVEAGCFFTDEEIDDEMAGDLRDLFAKQNEDEMLNVTAPYLGSALAESRLAGLTYSDFQNICIQVHAIRDYARRVPNRSVGLPDDGTEYNIAQKVEALSSRIWNDRSATGARVRDLLQHVLYGGSSEHLPDRLWQAVADQRWKIQGLGISALGELIGWAMPDQFPPRNGRTSKALRSLGYDATVHVE